ncbi:glycosyltransferase family 2 protein [Kluyvera georgiana]|uniref:glycosyltransferase family 2 protein n=1 Tax=Kluyvera georgiana TaxID=73098 RepID=UPI002303EFA1|nr:glycosyltransferase family 2 protein [Kluyvera georgiana]MDA8496161.1 glycosyltransferase [Kluyvera georgiana]
MTGTESVSIVMPTFNAALYISDSIHSILAQEYTDWHLYIIDDASTDNTKKIVSEFSDPRITYLYQPINNGVAKTRNIGIAIAQGRFIAFLDSDDIWEVDKLSRQVTLLEQGYDIVCSDYMVFANEPSNIIDVRHCPLEFGYSRMLRGNCIGNLTGIYNQERLGKCFQQDCGHEDYLMWLELLCRTERARCIQHPLARYRVKDNSLSSNKIKAATWQWHIYRSRLQMNLLKSSFYWCHYVMSALIRKFK